MSAWRRKALGHLPEQRRTIEADNNPMALWIELCSACERAHESGDESVGKGFYDFARWCWLSPNDDLRTAVACAFYEHLPRSRAMRRDMPLRFDRATFDELREVFQYHLSPDEAVEFERGFLEAKQSLLDGSLGPNPSTQRISKTGK